MDWRTILLLDENENNDKLVYPVICDYTITSDNSESVMIQNGSCKCYLCSMVYDRGYNSS